jgi:hypothetical protein
VTDTGGLIHASSWRVAQPGARFQKLYQRQRPEPLATGGSRLTVSSRLPLTAR